MSTEAVKDSISASKNIIENNIEKSRTHIFNSKTTLEEPQNYHKKIIMGVIFICLSVAYFGNEKAKQNIKESVQYSHSVAAINNSVVETILNDIKYENINSAKLEELKSRINKINEMKVSNSDTILVGKKFSLYLSNFIMAGTQNNQSLDEAKVKNLFLAQNILSSAIFDILDNDKLNFNELFAYSQEANKKEMDDQFPISKFLDHSFLKEGTFFLTKEYQKQKLKDTSNQVVNFNNLVDFVVQSQFLSNFVEDNYNISDTIYLNSIIYKDVSSKNPEIYQKFWNMTLEDKEKLWNDFYKKRFEKAYLQFSLSTPYWIKFSNLTQEKIKIQNDFKVGSLKYLGKDSTLFYLHSLKTSLKLKKQSEYKIMLSNFKQTLTPDGLKKVPVIPYPEALPRLRDLPELPELPTLPQFKY